MILIVKSNSEDNPNWYQAMNGPYSENFVEVTEEEIKILTNINASHKVKRKPDMHVLKSTWAIKVK